MSSTTHGTTPYYFVPGPSRHPVMAATGLFFVILGAGQWVNGADWGKYSLFFGLLFWLGVLYQWFSEAISESMGGQYGHKVDLSFRWSMTWFIFSEVMFFGAFFSALWWARSHSVPALGSLENSLLWPDFKAVWPSLAAGATASAPRPPVRRVGPRSWGLGRSWLVPFSARWWADQAQRPPSLPHEFARTVREPGDRVPR